MSARRTPADHRIGQLCCWLFDAPQHLRSGSENPRRGRSWERRRNAAGVREAAISACNAILFSSGLDQSKPEDIFHPKGRTEFPHIGLYVSLPEYLKVRRVSLVVGTCVGIV